MLMQSFDVCAFLRPVAMTPAWAGMVAGIHWYSMTLPAAVLLIIGTA
jgi:hypothetical protein